MDRNSRPRSRSGDSGRLPALRCAARGRHSPVLRTWEMPRRDSRPRSRSGHPAPRHAEASPWGRFVTSRSSRRESSRRESSRRESSLRSARGPTPPWPLRRLLPFVFFSSLKENTRKTVSPSLLHGGQFRRYTGSEPSPQMTCCDDDCRTRRSLRRLDLRQFRPVAQPSSRR